MLSFQRKATTSNEARRNGGTYSVFPPLQCTTPVQVMEMSKRVLGPEHPSTLTSMNNLAYT
ncbi:hypothetical protein BGZ57DRAFT_779280 [Hyaloscypha finlandica]|nr:hypothetical protein BGZ57DRAFT_779280 [Hyaloscypha finlandica]